MCLIDLVYTPAPIRSVYAPHHENARAARKGAGAQSTDVVRSTACHISEAPVLAGSPPSAPGRCN